MTAYELLYIQRRHAENEVEALDTLIKQSPKSPTLIKERRRVALRAALLNAKIERLELRYGT